VQLAAVFILTAGGVVTPLSRCDVETTAEWTIDVIPDSMFDLRAWGQFGFLGLFAYLDEPFC